MNERHGKIMKKLVVVFVIVISVLVFSACAGNGNDAVSNRHITVYELGTASDSSYTEGHHTTIIESWPMGEFQRKEAPKEMTIELNGQSYTGQYEYSEMT